MRQLVVLGLSLLFLLLISLWQYVGWACSSNQLIISQRSTGRGLTVRCRKVCKFKMHSRVAENVAEADAGVSSVLDEVVGDIWVIAVPDGVWCYPAPCSQDQSVVQGHSDSFLAFVAGKQHLDQPFLQLALKVWMMPWSRGLLTDVVLGGKKWTVVCCRLQPGTVAGHLSMKRSTNLSCINIHWSNFL